MAIIPIVSKMAEEKKLCPFCGSERLIKSGIAFTKEGERQRYQCRGCHRHTINPLVVNSPKEQVAVE